MNIPEDSENCASGMTAIYARKDNIPEPLKAFLKALRPVLNIPPAQSRSFLLQQAKQPASAESSTKEKKA